jgi:hypothetical protein
VQAIWWAQFLPAPPTTTTHTHHHLFYHGAYERQQGSKRRRGCGVKDQVGCVISWGLTGQLQSSSSLNFTCDDLVAKPRLTVNVVGRQLAWPWPTTTLSTVHVNPAQQTVGCLAACHQACHNLSAVSNLQALHSHTQSS